MNKDEIIRMAREAGPLTQGPFDAWCKRFAALVAADEREACEMAVEEIARKYQHEHNSSKETIADECAAAIRVRGML